MKKIDKEKMRYEQEYQIIGHFLHEFQRPLIGLRSSIEGLENRSLSKEQLRNSIDRMNGLIEIMLAEFNVLRTMYEFSIKGSIYSNSIAIEPINIINKSLELNSYKIKQLNAIIEIVNEISPSKLVQVDKQSFITAFSSLIKNSLQYCRDSPKIRIAIKEEIDLVVIQIDDWGVGIEDQNMKNIFNKGWRENRNLNVSGLGNGLWLSKKIFESNGFHIEIISKENPTSFKISGKIINENTTI